MMGFNNLQKWLGISWTPLMVASRGGGAASPSTYGDDALNSFAAAAVKVHRINNEYTQKMQQTDSSTEQEQIDLQASREMAKAVESEGLSVDTYQTIAAKLDSDDALAERVKEKLRHIA